jgi:predicted DNA-binding transcriptional regulator AlpA
VGKLIDPEELLDVGEVAAFLGLSQNNSVTTYMRRYGDFPEPVVVFAGGRCRAWLRSDVEAWVQSRRSAGNADRSS